MRAQQQAIPTVPDTLTGDLTRILYAGDNGFLIAQIATPDGPTTVKGTVPGGTPAPGARLRAEGAWTEHPKFGRQFAATTITELAPEDPDGRVRYLAANVRGLGEKRARDLEQRFGADLFRVIEHEPHRLAEVAGITADGAQRIHDSFAADAEDREARVLMTAWGMTARAIRKVSEHFGGAQHAATALQANPYLLAQHVAGYGFARADQVALKQGFPLQHPFRVQEGVVYALRDAAGNGGHTYLPLEALAQRAADERILGRTVPAGAVTQAVRDLAGERLVLGWRQQGDLIMAPSADATATATPLTEDQQANGSADCCALPALHQAEAVLAEQLQAIAATPHPPLRMQEDSALNPEQAAAVALVASGASGLTVITGGAGTGKTYVLHAILEALSANGRGYALIAPTGKAAKRMTEQTGVDARTIHRYLAWAPDENRFMLSRVAEDVLIVDEASMVDSALMAELVQRIEPERTRLILVGDVNQLPPVGAGCPFRDVIDSGRFDVCRLTRIMRTAAGSLIPIDAAHVLAGRMLSEGDFDGRQVAFIDAEDPAEIPALIANLAHPRALEGLGLAQKDVQVLSPMRKGPAGIANLNGLLGTVFNPDGQPLKGWQFRVGDRVIFGRNNYRAGYVNGDQGVVLGVGKCDSADVLEVDLGDTTVQVGKDDAFSDLQHAYAITVHKSQGSEYPCVIVPVHSTHYIMLQRNLLYTAITRGKQRVVLVGQRKALARAINNADAGMRFTLLREWLGRAA